MPSVETLKSGKALLQEMQRNPDLVSKFQSAKTYSQAQQIAKDAGFDLTGFSEEEAKAFAKDPKAVAAKGELSEEDLEEVAGGSGWFTIRYSYNW